VLCCWQEQLEYFERDGATAPFELIVREMLRFSKQGIWEAMSMFATATTYTKDYGEYDRRHKETLAWLERGFKDLAVNCPVVLEMPASLRCAPRPEGTPDTGARSTAKLTPHAASTPHGAVDFLSGDEVAQDLPKGAPPKRHTHWPWWCQYVAEHGLYEHDSVGEVCRELGAWFVWIELFHLPDRVERTTELLTHFVMSKHNGFVSRGAEHPDVIKQIRRCVQTATKQTAESKEQFALVRQKRATGKYRRGNIMLEPVLMDACVPTPVSASPLLR
jgi:hypothetical protein